MKKKIIFTTGNLEVGGVEKALVNLINNIDYNKYDVTLLLQNKEGTLLDDVNKDVHVVGYNLSKAKFGLYRKAINLGKMIIIFLKNFHRFDFSACFGTGYVPSAIMALHASRNNASWMHSNVIKFIENTCWFQDGKKTTEERCHIFIKNIRFRKFKKNIFVSQNAIDAYLSLYPMDKDKVVLCHNFVDGKDIILKSKEKVDDIIIKDLPTFVNISRHTEYDKKLSRIINASEKLKNDGYKFKVIFIGDGESREYYEKIVKEKKLEKNIFFYGLKHNPFPYLKNSDAFLLCSNFEGFPTTYTEALTLNIPIITTSVSDSETFIKNKYGIVVPNNDESIYDGMKEFLDKGFLIKKKFNYQEFNEESLNKIYSLIENK